MKEVFRFFLKFVFVKKVPRMQFNIKLVDIKHYNELILNIINISINVNDQAR